MRHIRLRGLGGLLALVFLYNASASLYNNMLPLLVVSMGLGPVEVSLASFLINVASIMLSPYSGKLGDKAGRKPFLAMGAGLLLAVQALVLAVRSYRAVLASAVLAGAAGGMFSVNATMAVVEAGAVGGRRPERPLASVGLASGAGWFTGMVLGGRVAEHAGLSALADLGLGLSAAALVFSLLVSESPVLLERVITAKPSVFFLGVVERVKLIYYYLTSFRNPFEAARGLRRRLDLYLAAMMLAFTAASLFFTQMPVYMKVEMRLSDSQVFTYLSLHSGVSTVFFALLYGGLASGIRVEAVLKTALAARAAAFLLPALLSGLSPAAVCLATFLVTGASWAMISVSMNSVALSIARPGRRGEGIGRLNSAVGLGILLGSMLSGAVAEGLGFTVLFALSSTLVAASLVLVDAALRARRSKVSFPGRPHGPGGSAEPDAHHMLLHLGG